MARAPWSSQNSSSKFCGKEGVKGARKGPRACPGENPGLPAPPPKNPGI